MTAPLTTRSQPRYAPIGGKTGDRLEAWQKTTRPSFLPPDRVDGYPAILLLAVNGGGWPRLARYGFMRGQLQSAMASTRHSQSLGFLIRWLMPTVLRFDGLRAAIYPNDHRPAHIHLIGADGEAVFVLNCPDGPPELRESFGFSRQAINRIAAHLATVLAALCVHWSDIHGNF